jgi:hypothetical protein
MTNHVAFAVNDLDGLRSYLASSGLDVLTFDEAPVQFRVQGPSGNVVEFCLRRHSRWAPHSKSSSHRFTRARQGYRIQQAGLIGKQSQELPINACKIDAGNLCKS